MTNTNEATARGGWLTDKASGTVKTGGNPGNVVTFIDDGFDEYF
jgi:hypothetical protein